MPEINAAEWENFLLAFPEAHILQTRQWGELKSKYGWETVHVIARSSAVEQAEQSGAQILFKSLPLGFCIGYIPKGPVGQKESRENGLAWQALWLEIDSICRDRRAIFLKVEPDLLEPDVVADESANASSRLVPAGFRVSKHSIQPPRTILIDIGDEEGGILGRMKQKTRYNIRLAQKKGIVVSTSADLDTFHRLMRNTGQRDQFPVHSLAYYQAAYEIFHRIGQCELFQAEFDGQPIAYLMAFARGPRAWYFYSALADVHRDLMPAYLLQWEAMRWARWRGCRIYDLWGVPDHEYDVLESRFSNHSGGLWGVYRFKRGFGGQLRRAVGPWDRVYFPLFYNFYRIWMHVRSSRNEHSA